MRIIAGKARSLPLKTVEGLSTRPTSDKIKETLFNMLQSDVPGACFLDLFAGSGQIGLEAVSRGADFAVFVENGKKAAACIAANIKFAKFDDQCLLMVQDARSSVAMLEGKYQFDIIFMDPPYNKGLEMEVLEALSGSSVVKPETIIIVEASLETDFSPVEELGFEITRYKKYKTNAHVFLRRK